MKTFFYFITIVLTIVSLLILLGSRHINNLKLFTNLVINSGSLIIMIYYIQSIGWTIINYCLFFITINNLILILTRFLYNNLTTQNIIKNFIGKVLSNYLKIFYIYPNYLIRKLISFLSEMLNLLNNRISNIYYDLQPVEPLNLISKSKDENNKQLVLTFENNKLLDHKNLFAALFKGLSSQEEFQKIGKKIMIVSVNKNDKTFHIHKNIIIDENTTLNIYLDKIKNSIQAFYESGYPITDFNILQIKLWEYSYQVVTSGKKKKSSNNTIYKFRGRGFHTTCISNKNKNINLIKPLREPLNLNKSLIGAIDLETIEFNNNQLPISISFSYFDKGKINTLFELIDYTLLLKNSDEAVKALWVNFMNKLISLNLNKCVIYSHNLGSFDGYFIYKGLFELEDLDIDNIKSIIDDLHRFISIDILWKDIKLTFKDSLRLFPISLKELTKTFEVEGKLQPYNPLFNKISLFKDRMLLDQFIEYSKQDSICLLKALDKAQNIYLEQHKVDFATIWSTSTLSFKLFRQKFLEIDIPILTDKIDSLIRLAYIGGSTDYYFKYGENLKHYDVNSLYPKAMCNPMPIKFLGITNCLGNNVKLEEVFGFAEARITTPENLDIPLLPFKFDNETLHPLGSWIGIYFTEELKAVAEHGYKIELIKVYNFSKETIFTKYIDYWYNIKKTATGALRLIAKLHLNTLYGYFGRRRTLIETKNVYNKDLMHYYGSHTIFSEIKINENISTILMSSNLDFDLINEINEETNLDLSSKFRSIKSYVGIVAAVTSYARIEMIKFKVSLVKLGLKLYYTDTDSIFVDGELPQHLVGSELGLMKDELSGGFIKKAYFLGIKKYGYIDNLDNIHSTFSGVERNSLTWDEIEQIARGFTIVKSSPARFYKNISNLNINIKNSLQTSIKFNTRKKLLGNKYLPVRINVNYLIKLDYYLRLVKNRILTLIDKYNLRKIQ